MSRRILALVISCALEACSESYERGDDAGPGPGPDAPVCTSWYPGDRGPDGDLRCSPAEEGMEICPGGTGSGWGYSCFAGCWQRFNDGPCAPPWWGHPDGGPDGAAGGTCGSPGNVGGLCAGSSCSASACEPERLDAAGALVSLEELVGAVPGEIDPDHAGFGRPLATGVVVPVPIAAGSLCTTPCDTAAYPSDACGSCASCSPEIGTRSLLTLVEVLEDAPFGERTGWCRADCEFDPSVRGCGAPTQTCSPYSRTCVDACVDDVECQARLVPSWDGDRVSILDPAGGTCDAATGRCRWSHPDERSVGDACTWDADCTADVGRCLRGGTCAELECAHAPDTSSDMLCDGGGGVCLGLGGNEASICVAGCATAVDCQPLHGCVPFGAGSFVGPYTGYCYGICDDVLSDPDGDGPLVPADDVIIPCRSTERCDLPPTVPGAPEPDGTCRAVCLNDVDCAPGLRCEMVAGAKDGVCRPPVRP